MKKTVEKTVLFAKNFYLQQELRGIVDYARSHDWRLEIPQMFNLNSHVRNWHGAGYLTDTPLHVEKLRASGVRIVALSADPRLLANAGAAVIPDNRKIGKIMADYFLARGFRHFGCCSDIYGRDVAFRNRLMENGFDAEILLMPRYFRSARTLEQLAERLRRLPRPCALFGNNDWEAAALCNAALRAKFRIPEDFAVAGVGNEELICTTTAPRLSSLETHLYERGFRAAAELDRLLEGAEPRQLPLELAPGEMVERGSTNFYAVPHARLRKILLYLQEHAAESLEISAIARKFHMGDSSLYRLFLEKLRMSPKDFLTELRFSRARTRLLDSDDTIETVAADCGFPSPGALFSLFRRRTGKSPSEWRQSGRNNRSFE